MKTQLQNEKLNEKQTLSKSFIFTKLKKGSNYILLIALLFFTISNSAATITSTTTGGNWTTTSTWVGGAVPLTTDTVIIASGATVTLTTAKTVVSLTLNSGATLNIGNVNALTVTNSFTNNGTFTATTGRLIVSGTTGNFTNSGTFTMGAGRLYLYGNLTSLGTHTLSLTQVRFYGTANQSIAGFTTTGLVTSRKSGGTATFTGNVNAAGITIRTSGGTLNLGSGLVHTLTGRVTLTSGALNGGSSKLNINVISTNAWNGTGSLFTAGTSTVNFGAAGNQTLSATNTTFNNLTFSNSGIKTVTTSRCSVNGIVSMEGTATVSSTPTYGTNATLRYNTATARTAGPEWITPFAGLGGVLIDNTGAITMNAAKVLNASVPLTILSGASLITNNFQLTFGGNFTNAGTFNAGSSPILINNTMVTQTISGFSTTGLVSATKTAGTATFTGNVNAAGLTMNGTGGTLNLGVAFNHTLTGNVTLTAGTLNGSSSTLNINSISTTAWNGTGSVFSAGTGTVNFGAAGNQTIAATATTFNNLTFSNSGLKTLTTATCTANGVVAMEGTATVSATPTFGTNATLRYNTATARTAGVEWVTPFTGLGGVIIGNTGAITMNSAKVFNVSVPLSILSSATLLTNNLQLNFGGNFTNAGTITAGSSPIIIDNTMTSQSIAGFATTGLVTMSKTAGTATFTGNTSGSGLTINGAGGALNLGTALVHNYSGNWTRTAGTLQGGSSILKIGGAVSGTSGTFSAGTGTIDYTGTTQTIVTLPYYNLTLSNSGTKSFVANTTISNVFDIASGVVANLSAGLTHTTVGLKLGGTYQIIGSWGGTTSAATNINSTYFSATTGVINNNCTLPTITVQPSAPTAVCSGLGIQSMSVTAAGLGNTYSWRKSGTPVVNSGVLSGQGTTTLTLTNPTVADAGSYDVVVTGSCGTSVTSTSVTVTVNPLPIITSQPATLAVCQGLSGSFAVATSAVSPSYQWQYATNPLSPTWINTNALSGISGSNSSSLNVTSASVAYDNYGIRCVITSSSGCVTYSNAVLLLVYPTPLVGAISANQDICGDSLPNSTISVASATGTIQWQKADNAGFTVNLTNIGTNSTSLTPAEVGTLTVTTYIRAVVSSGVCTSVTSGTATVTIASTTWSSASGGSWSNGTPTNLKAAIFSYNYTASADINACSITVDSSATVLIPSGFNVTLNGAITVTSGSFTLENNANLIQNTNATNTGNIIVKRNSSSLLRLDYTLWSSPVSGSQTLLNFSPSTLTNRFYTYDATAGTNGLYSVISSPSTTTFDLAKGYLIRMPNTWSAVTAAPYLGQFTGVPNNGDISFTLSNTAAGKGFNAIGNPYPSEVDLVTFTDTNVDNITGTLYFWRKTNDNTSNSYSTWSGGTFVAGSQAGAGTDPTDTIAPGQGFIIEASSTGTEVVFDNSMRVGINYNHFFRNSNQVDYNRIWLNAHNNALVNSFSQMAVGYITGATAGVDSFDGKYMNDGEIALTSLINTQRYAIQGRSLPFDDSDLVPLSFKATNAGNYTIAIDHVDGLFTGYSTIYLRDNLTSSITNLTVNGYSFAANAGTDDSRFELLYQMPLAINTATMNENNVIVYKQNDALTINTGIQIMASVKIFDIRGRLLVEKNNINATKTSIDTAAFANQVVLVQITSDTNVKVTKKFVN